jgi:DNA topoisomerase-1
MKDIIQTTSSIENLIYIYEEPPGITRQKRGRGFSYFAPDGNLIRRQSERDRLQAIAVPPTYKNVWYCPEKNGHLQATGFDSQEKKQYFYHETWRKLQDAKKFTALVMFGEKLPTLRRKVSAILNHDKMTEEVVLAGMVRILDRTGMRIGNPVATRENGTHGLTTLHKKNIEADGNLFELDYRAKGGVNVDQSFTDQKLAPIIDYCAEIPGQRLFKVIYEDETVKTLESQDLNRFLKEHMGPDISAKYFRTWRFSCYFLEEFLATDPDQLSIKYLLERVAEKSGNTPAILQKSYIHPGLIQLAKEKETDFFDRDIETKAGLKKSETCLLQYLETNHSKQALLGDFA